MRLPIQSTGTLRRASFVASVRTGLRPAQPFEAFPTPTFPIISRDCVGLYRSCDRGCYFDYRLCIGVGLGERRCAQRYFVCRDVGCWTAYEDCLGLLRDPNYDPYADPYAPPGPNRPRQLLVR